MSWRVRTSVLFAILWVAFGNMAIAAFGVFGIWFSILILVLFAASVIGIWRDRNKPSPVSFRRLWAGWLFALVGSLLTATASAIPSDKAQTGLLWLYRILLSGDAEGLELAIKNFHPRFQSCS